MQRKKRKPTHPGEILEEDYIQPLELHLQELADHLGISRHTLYSIRKGKAPVTAEIAVRLSKAFNTTPDLWLNLQQAYDLWCAEHSKPRIRVHSLYRPRAVHARGRRPSDTNSH